MDESNSHVDLASRRSRLLTPLGKEFRKWRIDQGLLLSDMAKGLAVSSSYLSLIENGGKPIPIDFVDRAIKAFKVDTRIAAIWRRAEILSKSEFRITVQNDQDREIAHRFVTEFARLSSEQKEQLRQILEG